MFGSGKEREKEWAAFEAEAIPLMADVFRVAIYLVRDCEEAEDLTQETFAQARQFVSPLHARNELPRLFNNDSLPFEQQAAV